MKTASSVGARRAGRPLAFDREAALVCAMHLFWRHGYEATSIADLTRAMGITPPSLYAAFGDKRRLFLEAVERYSRRRRSHRAAHRRCGQRRAMRRANCWFRPRSATRATTRRRLPSRQLDRDEFERGRGRARNAGRYSPAIEAALRARIERDIDEGTLPPNADAEILAGHVFAVVQGMSTLAKDGAGRGKLLGIVDAVMAGWPQAD